MEDEEFKDNLFQCFLGSVSEAVTASRFRCKSCKALATAPFGISRLAAASEDITKPAPPGLPGTAVARKPGARTRYWPVADGGGSGGGGGVGDEVSFFCAIPNS